MVSIGVHFNGRIFQNFSLTSKETYYLNLLAFYLKNFISDSRLVYYEDKKFELVNEKFHDTITVFNEDTGNFIIVDFRDGPYAAIVCLGDKNLKSSYASMFFDGLNKIDYKFSEKYKPFYFFDHYPNLTKSYIKKIAEIRKNKNALIPKMAFHGTIGDEKDSPYKKRNGTPVRNIVRILKDKYPNLIDVFDGDAKLPKEEWWLETSQYILTLTVPGHPWCFREHECWHLGIATISNTYLSPLPEPLIGDKHYVNANTSGKDLMGTELNEEKSADFIAEKFLSSYKNYEFIDSVERNAQERYFKYNHPKKSALYLLKEIKKFLF